MVLWWEYRTVTIKPAWILRDIPAQNFPVSAVTSLRLVCWSLEVEQKKAVRASSS